MPKVLDPRNSQNTLLLIETETSVTEAAENRMEVHEMLVFTACLLYTSDAADVLLV